MNLFLVMNNSVIDKLLNGKLPVDFNWNNDEHADVPSFRNFSIEPTLRQVKNITFVSEDLRDGLHGIGEYPSTDGMMKYIYFLHELGIQNFTIGIYPGIDNKIDTAIKATLHSLAKNISTAIPIVLTMASKEGISWIAECKKINPNLTAIIFMGTAPSRLLVEEWDTSYILERLSWAISEAVNRHNITVIGATEHTTQTPPDFLRKIITTIVKNGARYFCIADTIGIARPVGVARIIKFTRSVLEEVHANNVQIDWHGHDDLGNGLANAMTAIANDADRIHTVARGIGERAGNTRMESVLLNCAEILKEHNQLIPWKVSLLSKILDEYDLLTQNAPPSHGPLSIRAFRTSLGIHTAAMLKAQLLVRSASRKNEKKLAENLTQMARRIYSAIDPASVGRKHEIHVGPWSGRSTVRLVALQMGYNPDDVTDETVHLVLTTAKRLGRELKNKELAKFFD